MYARKRTRTEYQNKPYQAPRKKAKTNYGPPQLYRTGGRMPVGRTLASRSEKKNVDSAIGIPGAGVATGIVSTLNACIQGTTAAQRIGRRITNKSLLIRGFFQMAPTSTNSSTLRILVVWDKQVNAVAPIATDILANDTYQSPMNLNNSRRFKVICDECFDGVGTGGPQCIDVNIYRKMNLGTEFNAGNAGTAGDMQTGGLFALVYANAVVGVAAAVFSNICRIRFTDD